MNVYERQVKALENIAHELKGIGQSLKRIEETNRPPLRDCKTREAISERKSPGICSITGEGCYVCERWRVNDCLFLSAKAVVDTTNIWICGSTGLPCTECTPGACNHRRTEGGGNG